MDYFGRFFSATMEKIEIDEEIKKKKTSQKATQR